MTDPHAGYLARLAATFERWPELRKYAATAKAGRMEYWRKDEAGIWQACGFEVEAIVVTIAGDDTREAKV